MVDCYGVYRMVSSKKQEVGVEAVFSGHTCCLFALNNSICLAEISGCGVVAADIRCCFNSQSFFGDFISLRECADHHC